MYDWEKRLPKAREERKKELEERNKAEIEFNKRFMPFDFAIGIVLLVAAVVVVVAFQPSSPVCGDYQQMTSDLNNAGYWVDATGNPPDRSDILYLHYQSPTDEKVAVVDYRAERETCVVDCSAGQCDVFRSLLHTQR